MKLRFGRERDREIENYASTFICPQRASAHGRHALTPIRKAFVVVLALALLGVVSLGASGKAAATQNAPSWSTGDRWVYSETSGSTTSTLTLAVREQTSLTIGSTTYSVWHVAETVTSSSGSSSFSDTIDQYYTTDGLKLAKQNGTFPFFGAITTTYDAPYPLMVFPLNPGGSWIGSSKQYSQSAFGTSTTTYNWNGTVLGEQSVVVPAGTFTASVVWSKNVGGNTPAVYYYSEQVGWAVRIDVHSAGGAYTGSMNLTSYSYSPGFLGISNVVWIVLLVLAFVIVVGAVLLLRRRPRVPYPMQPPQPYPPPSPPQQPPQQGPPGR